MEGQFFGGAPGQQQQQQFVAPQTQQSQAQGQFPAPIPAPAHFQYGYVPQPFPYIATPPPPPPPAPSMLPPPPLPQTFFNPWEPPPTPVPPPADAELQKRIDKLVEFSAKNGPGFEALMKEKQKENPAYAFLFGADGHSYYKYKLWITIHPHLVAFNPALNMVNPALGLPAAINPAPPPPPPPPVQQSGPFPQYYDMQQATALPPPPPPAPTTVIQHPQPQMFDPGLVPQILKTIPLEMATELRSILDNLTGTKDSIKGARTWFLQRSPFAPALAEFLRDRITATENVDRQMNVLYLVNDILFNSVQLRLNVKELDSQAIAFRPVLSSILGAVYRNPHVNEADRGQVEKMLQFWGTKEVYEPDTVRLLEREMRLDAKPVSQPSPGTTTLGSIGQWQKDQPWGSPERKDEHQAQSTLPGIGLPSFSSATQFTPAPQAATSSTMSSLFSALAPAFVPSQAPTTVQQQPQVPAVRAEQPPYPLFPPGLIPGMVRKMQIGSGVPYSPLSPLDIPTVIPSSASAESYIADRVSKFFKDIGETDPLAGKYKSDDEEQEEEKERGGARIPPPPQMQVDPETGTLPDGSIEHRPGMTSTGRLGLGAAADPNEATQYDDVYTSYRKQRSTNYHTSLSARAAAR